MNKPSKKQLTDAVTHYQTGLTNLLESLTNGVPDDGEVLARVRDLVNGAPSLEPVQKAKPEAAAAVEDAVVAEETDNVVDPEAPAVA